MRRFADQGKHQSLTMSRIGTEAAVVTPESSWNNADLDMYCVLQYTFYRRVSRFIRSESDR